MATARLPHRAPVHGLARYGRADGADVHGQRLRRETLQRRPRERRVLVLHYFLAGGRVSSDRFRAEGLMSEPLEEQFREGRRVTQLWAGILLGPAAWATDFVLSYAVTHHECSTGAMLWHRTSSVIAVLVALWGAYLGWEAKH